MHLSALTHSLFECVEVIFDTSICVSANRQCWLSSQITRHLILPAYVWSLDNSVFPLRMFETEHWRPVCLSYEEYSRPIVYILQFSGIIIPWNLREILTHHASGTVRLRKIRNSKNHRERWSGAHCTLYWLLVTTRNPLAFCSFCLLSPTLFLTFYLWKMLPPIACQIIETMHC